MFFKGLLDDSNNLSTSIFEQKAINQIKKFQPGLLARNLLRSAEYTFIMDSLHYLHKSNLLAHIVFSRMIFVVARRIILFDKITKF
jgi:hypothetical protein